MKEQLISFETAKLAKEKGFGESSTMYYIVENPTYLESGYPDEESRLLKVTQSLLQKWLREHSKRIHIELQMLSVNNWHLLVGECGRILSIGNGYRSYEQALEKGLQVALKLIKQ